MCAHNNIVITTSWNFIPTFLLCSIIGIVYAQDKNLNDIEYYYNSPLIRYRREPPPLPPIYFTSSSNRGASGGSGSSFSSYDTAQPRTGYSASSPASKKSQPRSGYRPTKIFYAPPSRAKYGPPPQSYKMPSSGYGPPKGIYGGKGGKGGGGGYGGGTEDAGGGIADVINTKKSLKTALINGIKAIKGGILAMKGKFLKTKGQIIAAKGSLLEGFGQGIAGGGGGYGKSKGGGGGGALAGFGEIGVTLFSQISNLFTTLTSTFGQIFNINALGGLIGGFMEILGSFGRIGKLMVVGEDMSPVELKKLKNGNSKESSSSSSSIIATVMSSLSDSINDMVEIMRGLNETSPKSASATNPTKNNNNNNNNGIKMSSSDWEDIVTEIMKDSPPPQEEEVEPESENYVNGNSGPGYSSGISESGSDSGYMNNDMEITSTARDNRERDHNNDDDFNDILNMLEVLKEKDEDGENPITVKELGLNIPKFRRIPNDQESEDTKISSTTTTTTTTTEKPKFSQTLSAEKPRLLNDSKNNTFVNVTMMKDIFLDYFKRKDEEKKQQQAAAEKIEEKKKQAGKTEDIVPISSTTGTTTSTTTTSIGTSTTTSSSIPEDDFSKRRLYIIIINNQTKSAIEPAVDSSLDAKNITKT